MKPDFWNSVRTPAFRLRLLAVFTAIALFGGSSLNAQTGLPANVVIPEGIVLSPPGGIPSSVLVSTNKTAEKKSPESASPEDKRLQDLLKLQFDRRPQSIFKTLAKQAEEPAASTNEVARFEADVITGDWKAVKEFIARLPEKQAPQVYKHLLQQLQKTPSGQPGSPEQMQMMMNQSQSAGIPPAGQVLFPDDVLALSEMAPGELTDEQVELLGKLLGTALTKVTFIDPFLKKLEAGTDRIGGQDEKKRNLAAKLLISAGRLTDVGKFLPPLDPAIEKKEIKTIDLHARHLLALARQPKETNSTYLKKSWELTQMVLSATNAPTEERQLALKRSLELMPLLSKELGTNWLRSNFQQRPEQGMTVLATIGSIASQGLSSREAEQRRKNMELQYRVADALLSVVGESADAWKPALNVLAINWLQEADYAKQRYVKPRPQNMPQFDMYGNQIYFGNEYYPGNYEDQNRPPCVPPDKLLLTAPFDAWLAMLDKSLARRITLVTAELYLKLEDEQKALPHLEALVADEPEAALNLANEVLRSWARSHDPNGQQQNMQRFYYNPYGQMQPQGMSLTRAMQVRNLQELSKLLQRLRALSIGRLDDRAVVAAFSASHSQAEVFRVEDIKTVFGPIENLAPETLSELLQTMRQRLASQWRQPRVQQDAKTKRTDKEIEAEVIRGYELLMQLIDQGVARQPNDWRMNLVQGAAVFDSAEFDYGRKVDLAIYTAKRDKAFKSFEKAAAIYGEKLPSLEEKEQTSQAYLQWFNATLGASDLAYITRQTEPNTNNLVKIRQAILSLPGDASVRHIASFGKSISDSLNTLKGELKPRYLRAALQIVGDHESAAEARKLVTYYDDLLQEISLDVRVDGDAAVGHGKPFGLFVALRHSEAVGRESGGFSKYLQNQQNQQYYYNPYGTAPVNYRENFEKQVREKFAQGFEVVSVIFHEDKVQPRGYGRPGWRETPYAYILLKAKDGAVDRIPPLQLDLDFFDKRGQVVLPVTSQVQLIDARPDSVPSRPASKLSVLQILDDRDLSKGKITLEIKTTANGLLPELKELFDVDIAGFKIDKVDDQGLAINKLDAEGDLVAPISERNWLIHLTLEKSESAVASFNFPKAKFDGMELTYKRYSDADLVEVKPALALSGVPLKSSGYGKWILAAATLLIGGLAWLKLGFKSPPTIVEKSIAYTIPGHITPFTVLSLLRRMHEDATLSLTPEQRRELSETIQKLQKHYFDRTKESPADFNLEQLVKQWVSFAR